MVGVIGHVPNPSVDQAVGLAREAEGAGADWIGIADAFWWRDVWMLLAEVARATERIEIGPAMTNPYLRHRFHTASALATLQELAPGRVFCGVAAGGSEVTAAAGISRRDAAEQVGGLVSFLRGVAAGDPLDTASGRTLDVALEPLPFLVAGRGGAMLRVAGAAADRVLLWAIPGSDLERSIGLIRAGAVGRRRPPRLVWAPLVRHADAPEGSIMHVAVYASLNTHDAIRRGWGLGADLVERIRGALVAGELAEASSLVPAAAVDDLVVGDPDPVPLGERARDLGVTSLAVPGFEPSTVAGHVRWAATVEETLS